MKIKYSVGQKIIVYNISTYTNGIEGIIIKTPSDKYSRYTVKLDGYKDLYLFYEFELVPLKLKSFL